MKPLLTARAGASKKAMAYSAAGMYGAATFVGLVEGVLPGGEQFSPVPSLVALGFVILLLLWGPRLPIWASSGSPTSSAGAGPLESSFGSESSTRRR